MLLEAIYEPVVLQRSVEPTATNGALQGAERGSVVRMLQKLQHVS
jgi:hypothetical protein